MFQECIRFARGRGGRARVAYTYSLQCFPRDSIITFKVYLGAADLQNFSVSSRSFMETVVFTRVLLDPLALFGKV